MKTPLVSVVVLNYNGKHFLKDCITSLFSQKYKNLEIILVDNSSEDGSKEFVKSEFSRFIKTRKLKILKLNKNYGFAEGNNKGYKTAKGEFVLLLNNDTKLVDRLFLNKLVKRMLSDKKIALVSGNDCPFGSNLKKVRSRLPGTISIVGACIPNKLDCKKILWPIGTACLIRKKYFNVPFDLDYFAYMEDIYLGWLANLIGHKVVCEPEAKFWHHGSGTTGKDSPFAWYYYERNRLLNILTFFEFKTLLKVFPILILDLIIRFFGFLFFKHKSLLPFLKAMLWIPMNFEKILEKRKNIFKKRKLKDGEIMPLFSCKLIAGYRSKKLEFLYKLLDKLSLLYCRIMGLNTVELNRNKILK